MRLLITGGAGYIGSHATRAALDAGHTVTVLDDLSTGHAVAVDGRARFVRGGLADPAACGSALEGAEAVMHFAASSIVAASTTDPWSYWGNNLGGTLALLRSMKAAGVKKLIFSSTAATYGIPDVALIEETTPQNPINPYGSSKLAVERLIADVAAADPEFSFAALRYFNVGGCAWGLGESHHPETHLIPLILQAALGLREKVSIFGTDYPTPDGTCIRDYVHVHDLVEAHLRVLDALRPGDTRRYNIGSGRGWSVREVIAAAKAVTGVDFPVVPAERRPGDPASLVTSPARILAELGWRTTRSELAEILGSHWAWMREHPRGWA